MIIVTSDWHLNPGDIFPEDTFEPVNVGDTIVLNGDMLNILPHGIKRWHTQEGRNTVESILKAIPEDVLCFWLLGNHEGRMSWLKDLAGESLVLTPGEEVDLENYHFEHGHRLTEWRWLRYIADDLVELFIAIAPGWWYKFSASRGWIPSKYANPGDKYPKILTAYWAACLIKAENLDKIMIVGHSHYRLNVFTEWFSLMDCGARKVIRLF